MGDSGAGLTFIHNESYFLIGIVSLKDTTQKDSFAAFTDVSQYIRWICSLYSNNANKTSN